jgi:hypothetical protein
MNCKIILFTVLAVIACAVGQSSSDITLNVFAASNQWWIAVEPISGSTQTASIQLQEGGSSQWKEMTATPSWPYWQISASSGNGFSMPLSFRLTATNGKQATIMNAITTLIPGAVINTGVSYGSSSTTAPTQKPTSTPTHSPTNAPTQKATSAPTHSPTNAPTQKATSAPTHSPTQAPTSPPTHSPTNAPTQKATSAPTQKATSAPTQKATIAPTSPPGLCTITSTISEPLRILVPLYEDPDSDWDTLITSAQTGANIWAIINPNSGPDTSGPSSDYVSYMAQFAAAGITMLGYVHTSYGARAISDVQADINTYASLYHGLSGIFIDEAATDSSEIPYYQEVYTAITGAGYEYDIINPGTQPDQGYLAVATSIVIFEDVASNLVNDFSSWVTCAPSASEKAGYKYRFAGMAIQATQSNMPSLITTMENSGMGFVFVTDGSAGGNTYGAIPSFFAQEVAEVNALN